MWSNHLARSTLSTCARLAARGGSGIRPAPTAGLRKAGSGDPLSDPVGPMGPNDRVSTHVRNRNPMNLEKMLIGRKPQGFTLEKKKRNYWNR